MDFNNESIQRLYQHRNFQNVDSLISYFKSKDPSKRFLAANAFNSIKDPIALDALHEGLHDPSVDVRTAAAYSIGQIGKSASQDSLLQAFRQQDTTSVDNKINSTILEAVGKIGDQSLLIPLSTVSTYRSTDTLLLLGQSRAIYRYMLRGITAPQGTSKMVEFITSDNLDDQIRLYAAHYLARAKKLDLDGFKFQLNKAMLEEKNPNIKMALVLALGKIVDPEIRESLINQLSLNQDYRVSTNIIRSLKKDAYPFVAEKMLSLVNSKNNHIATAAVQYFAQHGNKDDAPMYRDKTRDSLGYVLESQLFEATFKSLPYYYSKTRNATRWQMQKHMEGLEEPRAIASFINVMSQDPESFEWLYKTYGKSEDLAIRTATYQSLAKMLVHPEFAQIFKSGTWLVRKKTMGWLKEAMALGDEGIIGSVAEVLANEKAQIKPFIDSINFLIDAKNSLKMPGQVESIHAVEKAIGFLTEQPNIDLSPVKSEHPINWDILSEVNDQTKALVKTNKGVFTIQFYLSEAPISVINWIELAQDNYFDNKYFHRVVPNFVIQTGSPRGDNYGGKDYTISSEFSQLYYDEEGYVGMASAGAHTESTQWFVTHSPTPHLDGKYTIFGKVIEGMDVVHKIQQDDIILDVIISNL